MMELVIASTNDGKIGEIEDILRMPGLSFRTYRDLSGWPEVEETGDSFEENAGLKATAIRDEYGIPALADDSGLVVYSLGGRPGVHSSRYSGPDQDPERNIEKLLREMSGMEGSQRKARFECVAALALPDGEIRTTRGTCEGSILMYRRGTGGFGYDPVFKPEGFESSMAELMPDRKNLISHRGKAFREMRSIIEGLMPPGPAG